MYFVLGYPEIQYRIVLAGPMVTQAEMGFSHLNIQQVCTDSSLTKE